MKTGDNHYLIIRNPEGKFLQQLADGGGPGGGTVTQWVADPAAASKHKVRLRHPNPDPAYYVSPHDRKLVEGCKVCLLLMHIKCSVGEIKPHT